MVTGWHRTISHASARLRLSQLLSATDEDGSKLSSQEVIDNVFTLVFAGIDPRQGLAGRLEMAQAAVSGEQGLIYLQTEPAEPHDISIYQLVCLCPTFIPMISAEPRSKDYVDRFYRPGLS